MKAMLAISPRLAVLVAILAVAIAASTYAAMSQETGPGDEPPAVSQAAGPGDDPATEPIPSIGEPESAQSIVATVQFDSPTSAQVVDWSVSNWPAPARTGGPPFIQVDVFSVDGALIETFSEWHPLLVENLGDDGQKGSVMEETGEGRFVFPYSPDLGEVMISDIELGIPLVEIDAHQIVVDYCETNPDDPGCDSVPGFCEADVNKDGRVNHKDLRIVIRALFTRPGTHRWNPAADVNGDGWVDIRDLLLVAFAFWYPDCH